MIEQKLVRSRLIQLINKEGTKQKFISEKTGIHQSLLSRFKKGELDLWESFLSDLDLFLKTRGY